MSNYPPTPSFGSYNGYFQAPLPPSGSNPMLNHPAYAQTRDVMPSHQQHFSPSQIPYNNNAYAYTTNNQVTNLSQVHGLNPQGHVIYSPPPPFSHHGPYPANITPPSSLPPVPPSNFRSGPRQVDQPMPQITNGSNLLPNTSLPPKPPAIAPGSMDIDQEDTHSEPSYSPDREDGELSDGELQGIAGVTERSSKSSSRPTFQHSNGNGTTESFSRVVEPFGNTSKTGEVLSSTSLQMPIPSSQDQSNQVRLSQHGQVGNARHLQPMEQADNTLSRTSQNIPFTQYSIILDPRGFSQNSLTEKQMNRDANPRIMREKSKDALRELHRNNIDFEKVVAEGVDDHVLRELYYELGIAIPSHAAERVLSVKSTSLSVNKSTPTTADFGRKQATLDNNPGSNPQKEDVHIPTVAGLTHKAEAAKAEASGAQLINTIKSVSIVSQSTKTDSSTKKSSLSTSADKTLERKDYIAKMLAAKTGKSVLAAKPTKVDNSPSKLEAKELSNGTSTSIDGNIATVPSALTSTAADKEKQADLEAKRKAQTELARKKIEALRNRTETREVDVSEAAKKPGSVSPLLSDVDMSPPNQPAPKPAPIVQKQPPVLPPQPVVQSGGMLSRSPFTPSFFSGGLKQGFSIPGLFTSSNAVDSSKEERPIASTNQEAYSSSEGIIDHLPSTQQGVLANVEQREEKTESPAPQQTVVTVPSEQTFPQPPAVSGDPPRKRPVASDFIDYSPAPTRRRLDSDEHAQVLIEVSEDEDDKGSDDMDMDDDTQGPQSSQPSNGSTRAKAIRDLPPLSDFPSRVKLQSSSAMSTPSLVQTLSKLKEQEQLKLKEEQILAMQRKIAEMERRRREKQDSSRAQSPSVGTPRPSEVLVSTDLPVASLDKELKASIATQQTNEAADRVHEVEKVALGIAETNAPENPKADQDAEKPLDTESNRLETIGADQLATAQSRLQRKIALETALPELDAQLDKTRLKLKNLKREVKELEMEIQRGVDGRRAIQEELKTLANVESEETCEPIGVGGMDDQSAVGVAAIHSLPVSVMPAQTEINGQDEPQIDASTASPPPSEMDESPMPPFGKLQRTVSGEAMDISDSSSDYCEITNSNRATSVEDSEQYHARNVSSSELDEVLFIAPTDDDTHKSPSEPAQQIYSTNYDSQGRAEDTRDPSESLAECNDSFPGQDGENAEVPSGVILAAHDKDEFPTMMDNGVQQQENAEVTGDTDMLDVDDSMNLDQGGHLPQPQDDNDMDDYEPPEPVLPLKDHANPGEAESEPFSPKLSTSFALEMPVVSLPAAAPLEPLSDSQLNSEQVTASLSRNSPTADVSTATSHPSHVGHFTPYDSPLKMFKSFRYHPLYISQVAGGFKSLTYSHNINLEKPVCRWELAGGICNDDSCESQHFRDMTLTENLILIQMTSPRKDSTDEEAAIFKTELRGVVQDMRLKGKKDFSSVAYAIAEYRSKPFGNGSKGLMA